MSRGLLVLLVVVGVLLGLGLLLQSRSIGGSYWLQEHLVHDPASASTLEGAYGALRRGEPASDARTAMAGAPLETQPLQLPGCDDVEVWWWRFTSDQVLERRVLGLVPVKRDRLPMVAWLLVRDGRMVHLPRPGQEAEDERLRSAVATKVDLGFFSRPAVPAAR